MTKTELFNLALKAGHDLGGKSVDQLVALMNTGEDSVRVYIGETKSDPISAVIYEAFQNVDQDDIETNLQYAIKQLQSALQTVQILELD